MSRLNLGSFVKIVQKYIKQPNTQKRIIELLMGFIIEEEEVLNRFGEPLIVTDKFASAIFNCKINVHKKVIDVASSNKIIDGAPNYFEDFVAPEIMPGMVHDLIAELTDFIYKDDTMPLEKKKEFMLHTRQESVHVLLSKLFLYAINKNNIFQNDSSASLNVNLPTVARNANKLKELLDHFQDSQPPRIQPPREIESHEMVYVRELLAAYADAEGLDELPKESLGAFPKHEKDFQRKRKDYYAAESLRRGSRDVFGEMASEHFDILKEETYDGIIDTYESEFPDGLARLRGVMAQASQIKVDKCVYSQIQHWVGNREKKGVCHMLINDGKLSGWVERNE
jgi:hypothetical protein